MTRRKRMLQELDEDIRDHLDRETQNNIERGMTPEEARYAALRKFGNVTRVKEETREVWSFVWLEQLLQDIRLGFRMLRKSPGFTAVAILTLALGIGANTAMFSVVNGVLLRPLPYRDPSRLVMVWEKNQDGTQDNVGYATYLDWKAQNKSFQEMAIYSSWQPVLQVGDPQVLEGLRVTSNYFRTIGVRPELGSDFLPEQDNPNNFHVVMLSHALWARKFNSDPSLVGRAIAINGVSYVVSGVMPANFESLMTQDPRGGTVEIWRVLGYDVSQPWACRTCHHLIALARLRDGVSIEQASAEMYTISAALVKAYPKDYQVPGVILQPLRDHLVGDATTPLYILLGAVSFVLLVACANLANLLLARATNREREVAVRAALGAGRGRIVRQLLCENCVLALFGAAIGLIPVFALPGVLGAMGAAGLPRLADIHMDWRVLALTAFAAVLTGVLSGLAPALRLSNTDLNESLKEGTHASSGGSRQRMRALLVVSEVALSLTLLIGAGLLFRSLRRLINVSPGFDPSQVLTLQDTVLGQKYNDNTVLRQLIAEDVSRLRAVPGVLAAAGVSQLPLAGNIDRYGFHPEGKINANPELDESAERYCITPGFLAAMRIPLLRGRDITDADVETTPWVILISQVTAKRIWPGEDPIGKRVKVGGLDKPWYTVVGIVGDVHHIGLDSSPDMQMYVPHAQWPFPDSSMSFVVRTSGPSASIASAARQAIRSADSTQALSNVVPLENIVSGSVQGRRFVLTLIAAFAAIALLLSAVGIYGVTAYSVAQRTREIGIRIALGAQRAEVLSLLLKQVLLLVLIGLGAGVAASLALTRFLASILFEVKPSDPATFAAVILLLVAVALLACWIPGRRAMRVDPIIALHQE